MGLSQSALWVYNSEPVDLIVFFLKCLESAPHRNVTFFLTLSPHLPLQPVFTVESIFFVC